MLFRLAWRNLRRNTRRTVLTAAAGAFAAALTLIQLAMAHGTHAAWIEQAVRLYTGHFEVSAAGFHEHGTLDYTLPLDAGMRARLDALDVHDAQWAPRLETWGLVMQDRDAALGRAVHLIGVDPARERVSRIGRALPPRLADDGRPGLVLGRGLAERLEVGIGDPVIAIAPDVYGSQSAERLWVAGTFSTGSFEFDQYTALADLDALASFLEVGDRVSEIAIFADDHERLDGLPQALAADFSSKRYELRDWKQLQPEMVQFVMLDDVGNWFMLAILISVVAFGLLNTILMSVFERTREFGVMRALGLGPRRVFALVVIESLALGAIGTLIGIAIAVPICLWFQAHPIALGGGWADMTEVFEIAPALYFTLTRAQLVTVVAVLGVVSLLAALAPALRAARGRPVDALRET